MKPAKGIDELPGSVPHPGDILMVCKAAMSDPAPFLSSVVVSAAEAARMRLGFQQPQGNVSRRCISPDVVKSIQGYGPRCVQQGVISERANQYLQSWVTGTQAKQSRPAEYSMLRNRQGTPAAYTGLYVAPRWDIPARFRNIVVAPEVDDDDDADCDDAAELQLVLD
jgi:hypothetical protein